MGKDIPGPYCFIIQGQKQLYNTHSIQSLFVKQTNTVANQLILHKNKWQGNKKSYFVTLSKHSNCKKTILILQHTIQGTIQISF